MLKRILKFAAAVLSSAAVLTFTAPAQAQQQTAILNSQIPLRDAGAGKTFDAATARYIYFAQNDPYIIDYDGVRVSGSFSLSKIQAMPLWKNYISVTPFLYLNTVGVRFECSSATGYQTVLHFAGRAPEVRNDNCDLRQRVLSQSDTN
jgi:hypothetical protein